MDGWKGEQTARQMTVSCQQLIRSDKNLTLILTDKTDSCTTWTVGICVNARNIPADIKNKSF